MFLTDLSIKRPVIASVMSLVLVLFGLVTFQEIPTDELPDVQPPIVSIQTDYKGASAEIVDSQITQKKLRTLLEVRQAWKLLTLQVKMKDHRLD